jgi:hypothetical protein
MALGTHRFQRAVMGGRPIRSPRRATLTRTSASEATSGAFDSDQYAFPYDRTLEALRTQDRAKL